MPSSIASLDGRRRNIDSRIGQTGVHVRAHENNSSASLFSLVPTALAAGGLHGSRRVVSHRVPSLRHQQAPTTQLQPGGLPLPKRQPRSRHEKELAEAVIPHFQKYSFIKSIEIIPTAYLTPGGGFENLDQLRALLGVDVVALLSFDQLQTSDSTEFSVLYWTIVGAYFIPAEANQTHTMVDAAVFDIASRQLLFRAPGTSKSQGHSTLVRTEERLRAKSDEGFVAAATNMVANLQVELAAFQQRVKDKPESVRIVRQPGYTGGGALGWEHAGLLGGVVLLGMLLQRPRA
ncbi:MAG: rhombotarget lipoprotein [Proteobacteria bacterium]|nr:rhombotarget lipoprotein [Pseudomonadota bacterium]